MAINANGDDQAGGRISFGKPFHIRWGLNPGESGHVMIVAEPSDGPRIVLAEDADTQDLQLIAQITHRQPFPDL